MEKPEITQAYIRRIMAYDAATGRFTAKIQRGTLRPGDICGHINRPASDCNYVKIYIDGRNYLAHRLAFMYMIGRWPNGVVDHIDQDGSNNAWSNLRECTKQQNHFNMRRKKKPAVSGHRGVYRRASGRWAAMIMLNRKCITLGTFDTIDEAVAARRAGALRYHGKFAVLD